MRNNKSRLPGLKFHEAADAVALMPTSHNCDDECVDGSTVYPATVYVHVFQDLKNRTIVFEDEHRLEPSIVPEWIITVGH